MIKISIIIILFIIFSFKGFLFAAHREFEMIAELERQETKKEEVLHIDRPKTEYTSEDLREPFESYIKKSQPSEQGQASSKIEPQAVVTPPALNVEGVFWGGRFPQAIINGRAVKVGDIIQEAQIVQIDNTGVTILFKNQKFKLPSPASGSLRPKSQGGNQ
ncbi:MAG: hypothetical protein NC908_04395 [Candidatus Omnitrophica bacterium]|nr:hypothetical protein [Candidatus Omnitrophota bacterium]